MVEEEIKLGPFFQLGVLFRRAWLALLALPYLKHLKLMAAHLFLFWFCSLHKAFQLLDKDTNPYGETPYSTLDKVARRFRILSKDHLVDLGSGRGLGVFWWATRVQCHAVGVDNFTPFITRARWLQERLSIPKASFIEGDFFEVDLTCATVIYLYGTALSDEMILRLLARFEKLERHVKIISVSYPLSLYSSAFYTEDQMTGTLPWGRAEFYLNRLLEKD